MPFIYRRKYKAPFLYVLQIWWTSLLLGPFVYSLEDFPNLSLYYYFGLIKATLFAASLVSLPWPFLFWLALRIIDRRPWMRYSKKLVAAVVAMGIAVINIFVAFFLWLGFNDIIISKLLFLMGAYVLPLVIAVWVYRWPRSKEAGAGDQVIG
jgi:hypothetical protein